MKCDVLKRYQCFCDNCLVNTKEEKITCRDNTHDARSSTYTYENPQQFFVSKYTVDGCLVRGNKESKCDFLVLNCCTKKAFFIELKGCNTTEHEKGIRCQLKTSIEMLSPDLKGFTIYARLIGGVRINNPVITEYPNIKAARKLLKEAIKTTEQDEINEEELEKRIKIEQNKGFFIEEVI